MPATIHVHPTAPLAERVLLPGDPGRALMLARELLAEPKMFNHNRGLWGYTGSASDGAPLTIQSTGMGGPSAAIVLEELVQLGARRVVRVGTCGALDGGLRLGDLVVATEALCFDGTSRALCGRDRVAAAPSLTARLEGRPGAVASTDLFYDEPGGRDAWRADGALAVEMEAAALFAVAERRDIEAACVLAVTDLLDAGGRERIDEDGLRAAGERAGRAGAVALDVD